jgi:tetratricopeptide (TPR) repeat protein/TolB-like protein/DNA-binding winged helix-turn-helix (wHTH) protein
MVGREQWLRGFHLGDSYVEPHTGTITGPTGTVHLSARSLEALLCLAENAGSVVAYDDLLNEVWGQNAGSHEQLSHAVSELRHALGDDSSHPKFVETVPRRGYRLLVEPVVGASLLASDAARRQAEPKLGFFDELQRRGVIETGLAYLVLGWLLIQIADVTFEQLTLPAGSDVFVTYLVIAGFPIALALSWFVEVTPEGVILDRDPRARPVRHAFGKSYKAILGGLAIAAIGVFVYDRFLGLPETTDAASAAGDATIAVEPNTIAVLPFLNIGGDDTGRSFSMGVPDDVINRLRTVPGLTVSGRGDSFSLQPNSPARDVRKRLRVAYYLEGSVTVADKMLKVIVNLINTETGSLMVSRSFEHKLEDFFTVQDEITSLTVANLRVALPVDTQIVRGRVAESPKVDAYVLYQRGLDALYKPMTRATIAEALAAFEGSLGVDMDYAAAHAGICLTYAQGYRVVNDATYIDAAETACARALGLNPNLYIVHNALGELESERGNYEAAEAAFGRALSINENSPSSVIGLGNIYARQGRLTEAEDMFKQAVTLQPGSWDAYNAYGGFLFNSGRYEQAAQQYREIVSLDDANLAGWNNLGASLTLSGQFSEALLAYQRSIAIEATQTSYSNLGMLHYYLGQISEAAAALEEATKIAPNDYLAWSNLGDVLSFSATPEKAAEVFAKAEQLAEEQRRINSRDFNTMIDLAWIKAMLDRFDEAAALSASALEIAPSDPRVHYLRALILARQGEAPAAIDSLETAAEMGWPLAMIAAEPHLRSLRDEQRFQELIRGRVQ